MSVEAESAVAAFDGIADSYDDRFTRSVVGRAQRGVVWEALRRTFRSGDRVLELNCGTGEDALFLARNGVAVEACDGSAAMIEVARRKLLENPAAPVHFRQCAVEGLGKLATAEPFDGALSNFGGLNCVRDLRPLAADLGARVRSGGQLVLCLLNRVCVWEILWYGARGDFGRAFRRVRGRAAARLGGRTIAVWYPTRRQVARAFAPWFRLRHVRAVGLAVPPCYLEFWARKHPSILARLEKLDRRCGAWPLLRGCGDHILLRFERLPG